ncbi:cyclophilin-like fold protein [Psychromarinibacter halotolerans]|uniref:Cyclophilin-like fold protein n=1 Tax=Psychromarinibacter halotolerans TaxID=1775175 RepID=A0ABV7GJ35_9RHOB|nr:cyclophilin-like fold protein [Psychromarinibacter halotolerans]MDF0595955.1 cyclophilin-like fold protein [Psychromarinibacter halotolerans]
MTRPLRPTRRAVLAGAATALLVPAAARAQSSTGAMRMRVAFDDQQVTYQLFDNPTVRDLISMLPAELEIQDFSNNEKIVHLPRRLDEGGFEAFDDETPGDLCYFLGWGNLALFHDNYTFRDDLIRLGHIEGEVTPLLHKGTYPVRIEMV